MTTKEKIDYISENCEDALLADGFDDAIVGIGDRCGMSSVVAYDVEKIIEILQTRDGMTEEEAQEFYSFNIIGAYVGEYTPIFLTRLD